MELSTQSLGLARKAASVVGEAYNASKIRKIEKFLRYADLRLEQLNHKDHNKLKATLSSKQGQDILFDFIESTFKTSSDIVIMTLALIYNRDSDFDISDSDSIALVSSISGLSDELVSSYLLILSVEVIKTTPFYERIYISSEDIPKLLDGVDPNVLYANINELQQKGLLLADPAPPTFRDDSRWYLAVGVSKRHRLLEKLLKKSQVLLETIT